MIVTENWIEDNFIRFNNEYFGGGLPLPMIGLSKSKNQLGTFSCRRTIGRGKGRIFDFAIRLTTYYDMTEFQAENVLLHEMIHYSIAYTGLRDTSAHGVVFRGMADNLNKKGWQIKAMTTTRGWKISDAVVKKKKDAGPQTYLVLALEMQDGKHFLSRIHPGSAKKINQELLYLNEVRHFQWYSTQEEYFENFPQCRSLRGRRISREDFHKLVNVMKIYDLELLKK